MKLIKKLVSLFSGGKKKSEGAKSKKLPENARPSRGRKQREDVVDDRSRRERSGAFPGSKGGRSGRGEGSRGRDADRRRSPRNRREDYRDDSSSYAADRPVKERTPKKIPEMLPLDELKAKLPEFAALGLGVEELSAISDMGYASPTPIQAKSIPEVLKGRDAIGTAQTGTGKTAAFSLPVVKMLGGHESSPRVLVLSPTRELAQQTAEAFVNFSKYRDLDVLLIQGGVAMGPQLDALRSGVDIVVATPGRLLDHLRQRTISLKSIKYLVLDEVDRMFDMGFIEDVSNIIRYCPKERQTLFFSATMPDAVMRLSQWALKKDAEKLDIGIACTPADTVEHFVYPVDGIQKYDLLTALIGKIASSRSIIFTRTRIDADRIGEWLVAHDYKVATLHSDRTQKERERALADFKEGKSSLLVATDIASRGLDISDVEYVINFNVPEHPEDYVHRIGRTGRANKEGRAITLYSSDETSALQRIEAFIGAAIERRKLDEFSYRNEPVLVVESKKKHRRRNM